MKAGGSLATEHWDLAGERQHGQDQGQEAEWPRPYLHTQGPHGVGSSQT